ncbi:hypothetical protein B0O80DRAFT_498904 [Mortierella sp. GBAus27b]|nr:hypothetical protein B0O80DRAFT_498904 [Mortierella sp. GBAus27b]
MVFDSEEDEAFLSLSTLPLPSSWLSLNDNDNDASPLSPLQRYGRWIRTLERHDYYFLENDPILNMLPWCPSLKSVSLPCGGETIRQLVPHLQALTNLGRLHLSVYGTLDEASAASLVGLVTACGRRLEHLELDFPRLGLDLRMDSLLEVVDACPNLKELSLSNICLVDSNMDIDLDAKVRISDQGIKSILDKCPSLISVQIVNPTPFLPDKDTVTSPTPAAVHPVSSLKRFSRVSSSLSLSVLASMIQLCHWLLILVNLGEFFPTRSSPSRPRLENLAP